MGFEPKMVDIRWDPEDLGAISVFLEGAWHVVPAVYDRFEGMHFYVWLKVCRALRSKSAARKVFNMETVFNAIDKIEDLVKDRSTALLMIDTNISDHELEKIQENFFSSFRLDDTARLKSNDAGPGREIVPRAPDPDIAPSRTKALPKGVEVMPSHDVEPREKGADTTGTPRQHRAPAPKFGLPPKRKD